VRIEQHRAGVVEAGRAQRLPERRIIAGVADAAPGGPAVGAVRGQRPLRDDDDGRLFYAQTPDDDWDAIAPGVAARFADRDEFEQARREFERDITRAALQRWTQGESRG
jgi:hypothetical protein